MTFWDFSKKSKIFDFFRKFSSPGPSPSATQLAGPGSWRAPDHVQTVTGKSCFLIFGGRNVLGGPRMHQPTQDCELYRSKTLSMPHNFFNWWISKTPVFVHPFGELVYRPPEKNVTQVGWDPLSGYSRFTAPTRISQEYSDPHCHVYYKEPETAIVCLKNYILFSIVQRI